MIYLTVLSVVIALAATYFAWRSATASLAAAIVAGESRKHDRWSSYYGALIEAGQAGMSVDGVVRKLGDAMAAAGGRESQATDTNDTPASGSRTPPSTRRSRPP
jgi:hypothetical protein